MGLAPHRARTNVSAMPARQAFAILAVVICLCPRPRGVEGGQSSAAVAKLLAGARKVPWKIGKEDAQPIAQEFASQYGQDYFSKLSNAQLAAKSSADYAAYNKAAETDLLCTWHLSGACSTSAAYMSAIMPVDLPAGDFTSFDGYVMSWVWMLRTCYAAGSDEAACTRGYSCASFAGTTCQPFPESMNKVYATWCQGQGQARYAPSSACTFMFNSYNDTTYFDNLVALEQGGSVVAGWLAASERYCLSKSTSQAACESRAPAPLASSRSAAVASGSGTISSGNTAGGSTASDSGATKNAAASSLAGPSSKGRLLLAAMLASVVLAAWA